MSIGGANRTAIYRVKESTWGTTPSNPNLIDTRYTGEGINSELENITSDEIRSDRQTTDLVQVSSSSSGNLDIELSFGAYDDMLESAMQSTFVNSNSAAVATVFTAGASGSNLEIAFNTAGTITLGTAHTIDYVAGQRIVVAGASTANNLEYTIESISGQVLNVFPVPGVTETLESVATLTGIQDQIGAGTTANTLDIVFATAGTITLGASHSHGIVVNQWIGVTGATNSNNNQVYRVTAVSGNALTVSPAPGTNETNQSGAIVSGARLRNGTTPSFFTIQKRFNDTTAVTYHNFTGMYVDTLNLSFETGAILSGGFGLVGKGSSITETQISGATDVAAATGDVMNSVSNIQNVEIDNVDATLNIQSLSLDLTNNLREQRAIGSVDAVGIGSGRLEVTGGISIFFESKAEYEKFVAATAFKLSYRVQDSSGQSYVFTYPRIKYESMTMNASGTDTDIILDGTWRAIRDADTNSMIQIDKISV